MKLLTTNDEISQDKQIVYCNIPVNYPSINDPQFYVYLQQLPPLVQQPIIYSKANQQQAPLPSYHPPVNATAPPPSSMTNPIVFSTSISTQTKRSRNDISGVSESNVQIRPQHPQTTRIFNSTNTPSKGFSFSKGLLSISKKFLVNWLSLSYLSFTLTKFIKKEKKSLT